MDSIDVECDKCGQLACLPAKEYIICIRRGCSGRMKPLTQKPGLGAKLLCDEGLSLPLLLADELLEDCWSATSKLESQVLRNSELPEAYKEIIEKSFAALRKLQERIMAR